MDPSQRPPLLPEEDWPALIPAACTTIVAINATVAVLQNRFNGYTLPGGIIAALLIVSPFAMEAIGALRKMETPRGWLWLFPISVAIGVGYFMFHPATVDVAPFILVFLTGEVVSRSRGQLGLAIYAGVLCIATVVTAEVVGPWSDGAFIWVAGIAFGWVGGYLIRELMTRTVELELAQAGLAAKAAAEERSRIAREVHDVIAHSLSVTMLHVTAARMALEHRASTDEALDALREAEQQGRRSLTEVRRTVGLLGSGDITATPMPTASDLPQLVADFRNAGLDVALRIQGDLASIPAGPGLGIYRIVQESLTNVVKHAPAASASVELSVADEIDLRVHNDGVGTPAGNGDGLGLKGMAERAALLGGTLRTHNGDGGWTVEMHAPRPAPDPA